jgi:hypothetical protein
VLPSSQLHRSSLDQIHVVTPDEIFDRQAGSSQLERTICQSLTASPVSSTIHPSQDSINRCEYFRLQHLFTSAVAMNLEA